jgi:hypothetical protein
MAELKTKPTKRSVVAFLNGVGDPGRRRDCKTIVALMKEATGESPKMWGPSIVGFGKYHYRYASGHEGETCLTGFSPRKDSLTLYLGGFKRFPKLMKVLGKHKTGGGCLYIKKLEDVDLAVLRDLLSEVVAQMRRAHPSGQS